MLEWKHVGLTDPDGSEAGDLPSMLETGQPVVMQQQHLHKYTSMWMYNTLVEELATLQGNYLNGHKAILIHSTWT